MAEKAVKKKRKKRVGEKDIIVLENVSKSYETGSPALNDISLRIRRGSLFLSWVTAVPESQR